MDARDKAESVWREAFRRLSDAPHATDKLVAAEDEAYRALDAICRERGECVITGCRSKMYAGDHCRKHRANVNYG